MDALRQRGRDRHHHVVGLVRGVPGGATNALALNSVFEGFLAVLYEKKGNKLTPLLRSPWSAVCG